MRVLATGLDPFFLSRIQFAFVISFHIIFPSFTIGLAAWLATIEGARLATGNPIYRRVFDFWLKVFAVSFGMGVVTGIVMAFQFGTNWSVLAQKAGPIQGPLLGYEAFTAFMLEATFFGVMLLGRERVSPAFYFFSCCMVSLGTMCAKLRGARSDYHVRSTLPWHGRRKLMASGPASRTLEKYRLMARSIER
jgi:cytochrome d ubiquinol oxidase subunit I